MDKVIPFAHSLLREVITPGDVTIDATCGNGNDTLVLAACSGTKGHVYAFDIQEQAIKHTATKLEKHAITNVTCIQDSHVNMEAHIPQRLRGQIAAAVFNLGYLPKSDKTIMTTPNSTIAALTKIVSFLRVHGRIVLVVYHGHAGGKEEKDAVLSFVHSLDQLYYEVVQYGFINQQNKPPFVIGIEKVKQEEYL